jgi:hypothetical protein
MWKIVHHLSGPELHQQVPASAGICSLFRTLSAAKQYGVALKDEL